MFDFDTISFYENAWNRLFFIYSLRKILWGKIWPKFFFIFSKTTSQIWDFGFNRKDKLWEALLSERLRPNFFSQKVKVSIFWPFFYSFSTFLKKYAPKSKILISNEWQIVTSSPA